MWLKVYDYYMHYTEFVWKSDEKMRRIKFSYPGRHCGCLLFDKMYLGEYEKVNLESEAVYELPEENSEYIKNTYDWDLSFEFERLIKDSDINFQMPKFIADHLSHRQWYKNGVVIREEEFFH